tara:strand:+ start:2976 stop:3395 length:420 start_codon:yes stop_codon:yes gene_type:complete
MVFKYFLDSDVILEYFLKRIPFNVAAREIFQLAYNKKIEVATSSLAISNIHYVSKKQIGNQESLKLIEDFIELCKILAVSENEIYFAIKSNFADFEDAIQNYSAVSDPNIKSIITRNVKDYKNSVLPIYSPDSFLGLFK